ncbi:MAG: response regulator, partial [Chloroflexi bacterium]|nr:response regulator [Chloroflexota bacterium]
GKQGLDMAREDRYDLVVLDIMMPEMDGYEVCRRLRATPGLEDLIILVLTARAQPVDFEMALLAGADSLLAKPVESNELRQKVASVLEQGRRSASPAVGAEPAPPAGPAAGAPAAAAPPRPRAGRTLALTGLRGGVGRTTVAVNLAAVLLAAGRKVCLLDLSRNSGHVSLWLRLPPGPGWSALPAQAPEKGLGKVLQRHPSGLVVLPAPAHPTPQGLSPAAWNAILDTLLTFFDEVVADLPSVLDDAVLAFLRRARPALCLLTPEPGAVQTTFHTLQSLPALGLADGHLSMVLNRVSPAPALPPVKVQQALGRPLLAQLPYDPAQPESVMQGAPLALARPASLAKTIAQLAARL